MTAQCDDLTEERETSLFIQSDFHDMCSAVFSRVSSLDYKEHRAQILKNESSRTKHLWHRGALCLHVCVYIQAVYM